MTVEKDIAVMVIGFTYGLGGKYGMNTSLANQNPNFRIDKKGGVINFSTL